MLQRAAAASWIKQKGQRTLLVEKVGNIKTRIKENLHYLPFILLGAALLYFHFHIETNHGDDVVFRARALTPDFNLFLWLKERYMTWSSRTIIEMLMMIMVALPQTVWRILNAVLMTVTSVFISKIFCKEEYNFQKNWIIAGLSFTIDVAILKEAGWIATSLNYIWPLAFGMISIYLIKKVCRNQEVRFYEYIIYTICLLIGISSEQLVFVLLIVFGAGNVIWYQANKRINKYLAVQLLICIAGLVNAMACPGNALRTADSIEQFFPAFADFGIIKKVELGISYTLKTLFLQDNIWMLMFLILLCAAIWMKYDNWFYKVLGAVPAAGLVLLRHAHRGRGEDGLPFSMLNEVGVFRPDTLGSFKIFFIYTGLLFLCCVILIDIYILFGNTFETLLTSGIFLLGLMTRAMMGFSPTIWKSGGRTAICLMYALLCCSVTIIETWDFREKKTLELLFLFVMLAGIGGFVDNYNYIFVIK